MVSSPPAITVGRFTSNPPSVDLLGIQKPTVLVLIIDGLMRSRIEYTDDFTFNVYRPWHPDVPNRMHL